MLNYGKQWIDALDIEAVVRALTSDYLTQGPEVAAFEEALAEYTGARWCVAVANGTAALHLAVQALEPEKGSLGITSPITFAASANCFLYNGMTPVFADINPYTYCISPKELKQKMSRDVKIVIPVHFAGQSAEMEKISAIAAKYGAHIIEDACHAIGGRHHDGSMIGSCSHSDMAVFSFHPVKTIATGEGGAITTNNKEIYEKLLMLRSHGITKKPELLKNKDREKTGPWYYEMQDLGFNYRLTDIQAALGRSQLSKIDSFVRRRREIVDMYNRAFKNAEWLVTPHEDKELSTAFHLYVLKIDYQRIGKSRTQVMAELLEKGIGTQAHYIPVHLHPYYREHFGFAPGDFPEAELYYRDCLSIPLYPKMTDAEVTMVREAILALPEKS